MPQPSMRAGELASRTQSTSSSRSRLRLVASPSTCDPRLPRLTDLSATPIAPAWMRMESRGSRETGMTASEAAPAPWEIWHARFNFDDRGYKFRPVLVLARTQDGLLAAMITSASNKHSPRSPDNGAPQQFSTDTTRRNPTRVTLLHSAPTSRVPRIPSTPRQHSAWQKGTPHDRARNQRRTSEDTFLAERLQFACFHPGRDAPK